MENNCMANPCEGCTEEACVEMMKKLQADEKVKKNGSPVVMRI